MHGVGEVAGSEREKINSHCWPEVTTLAQWFRRISRERLKFGHVTLLKSTAGRDVVLVAASQGRVHCRHKVLLLLEFRA